MFEYYMFHKPRGCISARCDPRHKTVMDYFPGNKRDILFPVGRLDKDTEGFLIVTSDGELCHELLTPENNVPKTYFFWALGEIRDDVLAQIESGVCIYKGSDFETAPSKVELVGSARLCDIKELLSESDKKIANKRGALTVTSGYVTVTEGKKHQVKRMIGYSGSRVVYLKRISIGKISLDADLAPGEYRSLTSDEVEILSERFEK